MIKYYKYLLPFAISTCYAVTEYLNDVMPGVSTASRTDQILIGSDLGSFAAYTPPPSNVTNLVIVFVQSGTAPGGIISTPFPVNSFPSTLKEIKIAGDVTGLDALVGNAAGNALPTPPDGCTVRFALTQAPATPLAYWFRAAMGAHCRVVIEPGSADPGVGSIITGFASTGIANTNALVVASNIEFPASLTNVDCRVQRDPRIPANDSSTKAKVTMTANTIFNSSVNGISLAGAYSPTFNATSDIIDPASNLGIITVNGTNNSRGTILTLVSLAAPLPTLTTTIESTGSSAAVTKVVSSLAPLPLPSLCPALLTTY